MIICESPIYRLFSAHIEAPQLEFQSIISSTKSITLKPNQTLLALNSKPENIFLVESGLLRAVYHTEDGKACSKEFYWENDIIFAIRSLISTAPLPYSVESVEACRLYQVPTARYLDLVDKYPEWKNYHMAQLAWHLEAKEMKEELLLVNSNEQKVKRAYELFPDFVKRVPATLLASYLNLNPVSLSRIKKRLHLK